MGRPYLVHNGGGGQGHHVAGHALLGHPHHRLLAQQVDGPVEALPIGGEFGGEEHLEEGGREGGDGGKRLIRAKLKDRCPKGWNGVSLILS